MAYKGFTSFLLRDYKNVLNLFKAKNKNLRTITAKFALRNQSIFRIYNARQDIWNKIKKSSKIGNLEKK